MRVCLYLEGPLCTQRSIRLFDEGLLNFPPNERPKNLHRTRAQQEVMSSPHILGLEQNGICGGQVRAQDDPPGELGWWDDDVGGAPAAEATTGGDEHAIPLAHRDQQRVGGHWRDKNPSLCVTVKR